MKKSLFYFSLLSETALLFPELTIASGFPTHTYTPEPEPIFEFEQLGHAFKTAAVCFLGTEGCGDAGFGSMGGDDGYQIDTAQQCRNEGYTVTSCSLPAYPSGQCPYNGGYFAKCVEDKPRACEETGFGETDCAAGTVIEATCSYDANYKKCKCDPCDGYDYTYEQATAQGYITDGSCQSCSETKYKRKENPCSGYSVCECGGEVGASTCYTGSTKKFSQCKSCDPCPGYYDCGGSWQYCTGSTCSADASKCSVYCSSDYFPNKCDNASDCNGIYRNGYCSGECDSTPYCEYTEIPFGSACSLYENNPTVGCYRICLPVVSGVHETITLEEAIMWNGESCDGFFHCDCPYENSADGVIMVDSYPPYFSDINEFSTKEECEAAVSSYLDAANDFCANACAEYRQEHLRIFPYY